VRGRLELDVTADVLRVRAERGGEQERGGV
jgi:hypothetical protein